MFNKLLNRLFGGGEPDLKPDNYQLLLQKLEDIDGLTTKRFTASKSKMVSLRTTSNDIEQLAGLLVETALYVSGKKYLSESRYKQPMYVTSGTLEQFITVGDSLIHPLDWILFHRHYIITLIDAFILLDDSDKEYYRRRCNFIVDDLLELITAFTQCIR